jgi:serine/threonine-protein kinase PRP4
LKAELLAVSKNSSETELKRVTQLADFLEKTLTLNPQKRLTPEEALSHPFIHLRNEGKEHKTKR